MPALTASPAFAHLLINSPSFEYCNTGFEHGLFSPSHRPLNCLLSFSFVSFDILYSPGFLCRCFFLAFIILSLWSVSAQSAFCVSPCFILFSSSFHRSLCASDIFLFVLSLVFRPICPLLSGLSNAFLTPSPIFCFSSSLRCFPLQPRPSFSLISSDGGLSETFPPGSIL